MPGRLSPVVFLLPTRLIICGIFNTIHRTIVEMLANVINREYSSTIFLNKNTTENEATINWCDQSPSKDWLVTRLGFDFLKFTSGKTIENRLSFFKSHISVFSCLWQRWSVRLLHCQITFCRNMATSLKTLSNLVQNKNVLNFSARYVQMFGYGFKRNSHILRKENPEDKIVMADNGATIVCWHPQPK